MDANTSKMLHMGMVGLQSSSHHSNSRMMTMTMVRPPLWPSLSAYNQTWCNEMVSNYNQTLEQQAQAGGSCSKPVDNSKLSMDNMKLMFTVVLMAVMGSTIFVNGFLRTFLPRLTLTVRLFLGRYNLDPIVRFLLHFAFFQFLPLLSTVFANAEGESDTKLLLILLWMLLVELIRKKVQGMMLPTDGSSFSRGIGRFTLMDYSDEASRLVWVGFLIYSTLGKIEVRKEQDLKPLYAVFLVLWSLGVVKLVQRVVNTWLASSSWHTARNPILIAGYMQQVMEEEEKQQQPQQVMVVEHQQQGRRQDDDHDEDNQKQSGAVDTTTPSPISMSMSECKFVVMGEDKLVDIPKEKRRAEEEEQKREIPKLTVVTTHGYGYGVGRRVATCRQCHCHQGPYCDQNEQKQVSLLIDTEKMGRDKEEGLMTVGKIWDLHKVKECQRLFSGTRRQLLEDLCLAFSLFKMLRRRFEHCPMVEVGSAMARRVMLEGLLNLEDIPGARRHRRRHRHHPQSGQAQRPFRVLQLELEILTNYYQQAAAPVVMSQPILFFGNFVFSMIFLLVLVASILYILVRNHEAAVLYCFTMGYLSRKPENFPSIYLCITMLLVFTVIAIETYEFWTLYVFSNWNIVRLACYYTSKEGWARRYAPVRRLLRNLHFSIIAARFFASANPWLTKTPIKLQQVSIVGAYGKVDKYAARVNYKPLHGNARQLIVDALKQGVDPDTGLVRLPRLEGLRHDGKTTSTEVILACHLATELLLETSEPPRPRQEKKKTAGKTEDPDPAAVAGSLSKYCMYLVAHVPQLLPDDETWVAERYEDVRSGLQKVATHSYAPTYDRRRLNHAWQFVSKKEQLLRSPATRRGMQLFDHLKNKQSTSGDEDAVWKDLAQFWASLIVYLAPSNDVQGHAKALATWGGDLITCLWAFCTHAGITRHPLQALQPNDLDHNGNGDIAIATNTMV